jgi:hypothetical protein
MDAPSRSAPSQPGVLAVAIAVISMAAYRLAPHPWNLAPAGALFALSGVYLGRGPRAWLLPFAAILVSDALIYLRWDGRLVHPERLGDYAAFALVLAVGSLAKGRATGWRVGSILVAPVVFYLCSNFAVWLGADQAYPRTLAGLADCYVAGIPFFQGTLVGDWVFGLAGMAVIEVLPRLRERSAPSAAASV